MEDSYYQLSDTADQRDGEVAFDVINWQAPRSNVERRKYCQHSSTDDGHKFVTQSIHLATVDVPGV